MPSFSPQTSQANRLTPRPPRAGAAVEHASAPSPAGRAVPVVGEVVLTELVPVALDQQLATVVALRARSGAVVHVPRVGVADAIGEGDAACARECLRRRRRAVEKLEVGVERGE